MSAVLKSLLRFDFSAEWLRLELLGHCLSQNRQGQEIKPTELDQLQKLQHQVDALRAQDGAWVKMLGIDLNPMELEVLACVVAPDLEPRVGRMYQSLQGSGATPYPSRALVQELLALEPAQASALNAALAPSHPLRVQRLIRMEQDEPYSALRPEPWVARKLMGQDIPDIPPPGATRVETGDADWETLVLPQSRMQMLQEYLLWMAHRQTVVEDWGGIPVGGPLALFSGPSGTGKTFAASVIANSLGWPLYRIDLGRLVSKYIGETEENLNALFDAAHGRPMVLQFDEADSLFAKRGEIKEARDRYANMEVSHLLARIEVHQGPCILTTNLRKQMDPAFARRFQMVVEFPRPDATARAQLWRKLLPPRAPRKPEIDPAFLGPAVTLTGGAIRNAALHAAYLAAGQDRPLDLSDIALAVWRELGKEGREIARHDLSDLALYLPESIHD
jgi:SpoVK/Ycf46/Vps4 family AAA+-type ATPase